MKRWQWLIVVVLILAVAISLVYLWQSPRLVDFTPADGALDVQANSELQITFSAPMQTVSVQTRLTIIPAQRGSFRWQDKTLTFTPDQLWPAGQEIRVRLASGAQSTGLFGLALNREVNWSFRIGQPRLVYLYPTNGPANLYLLTLPTGAVEPGAPQRLTDSVTGIQDYSVTLDGRAIYFSVRNTTESSAIYRMDLMPFKPPQPVTLILECPKALCRSPVVSPQGDYLAFERTAFLGSDQTTYPQVWLAPMVVDEESGKLSLDRLPTPVIDVLGNDSSTHQTLQPDWSADGWLTYYDSNLKVFILVNPRSAESQQFANQTGQPGSWNPSGKDYVVSEINISESANPTIVPDANSFGNSHLIRFTRSDGSMQDLTHAEDLEDTAPAYSLDGAYLAFARKYLDVMRWTPGRQLWVMQADGEGARPLTSDPYYNYFDFSWSPTSAWIACVRFNQTVPTEPTELWVVDPLTGRGLRLVVGGYAPQWIP